MHSAIHPSAAKRPESPDEHLDVVASQLPGTEVRKAWQQHIDGDFAGARASCARLLPALANESERGVLKPLAGVKDEPSSEIYVDDNRTIVIRAPHQAFFVDARNGGVRATNWMELSTTLVGLVPHQPLFIVHQKPRNILQLVDANGPGVIEELEFTRCAIADSGTAIALSRTARGADGDDVAFYDLAIRKMRWQVEVMRSLDAPRGGVTRVDSLRFFDHDRVVGGIAPGQASPFVSLESSTGETILRTRADGVAPAFTSDGRLIAYVTPSGALTLAERSSGHALTSTKACGKALAVAFVAEDKELVVQTSDRQCRFDVPSLRPITKAPPAATPPSTPEQAPPPPTTSPLETSGIRIPVCEVGGWLLPAEACQSPPL